MIEFDRSLPMILHRALDAIMPAYRDLFARHDLTEQQWRVLRVLWTSEQVTSAELAHRTLISPSSLVGVLDRLVRRSLVTRLRSVDDRRIVYVRATSEGRALGEIVSPAVAEIDRRVRETVSTEDWAQMEVTLQEIVDETESAQKDGSVAKVS